MTDQYRAFSSSLLSRRAVLGSGAAAVAVGSIAPHLPAQAQVRIDITKGQVQPMPIAVSPFTGAQPQDSRVGQDMTNVIASNLERSGLFKPIDSKAYIQTAAALRTQPPRFPDWRAINAQVLIHGNTEALGDGRMRTEFRLWDVLGKSQMEGRVYTTSGQNWRRVSHIISDAIYKRITGEDGYFDTRVVYIAESGRCSAASSGSASWTRTAPTSAC